MYKILNDPIYGLISLPPEVSEVIRHPIFQRLRRIHQLSFTDLVYPGARHTRFQHVLGALHLANVAIETLKMKGVAFDPTEIQGLRLAILLHDIGHAPYSHALEWQLVPNVGHEQISQMLIERLDQEIKTDLRMALSIFRGEYHRPFLHQLISGQIDLDRLDYLKRDSYFTGVAEGAINSDRLIAMFDVVDDRLVVEAKGSFSIENFIIARRMMYWQVYLHKTVYASTILLQKIISCAQRIALHKPELVTTNSPLDYFLIHSSINIFSDEFYEHFSQIDDVDILFAIKRWQYVDHPILSTLCKCMINRSLYKITFSDTPHPQEGVAASQERIHRKTGLPLEDIQAYICFSTSVINEAYKEGEESILILQKDKSIIEFEALNKAHSTRFLSKPTTKYSLCTLEV